MSDRIITLEDRLDAHPVLKQRVEALLHIVEAPSQEIETADTVEVPVIDVLRKLGTDVLQEWASTKEMETVKEFRDSHDAVVGHGKKNCLGTPPLER